MLSLSLEHCCSQNATFLGFQHESSCLHKLLAYRRICSQVHHRDLLQAAYGYDLSASLLRRLRGPAWR